MQSTRSASLRMMPLILILSLAALLTGCHKETTDTSLLGTFRMGEKVQVGPLTYSVLESHWKTELSEGGRVPRHRFLFVRLNVTNSGQETIPIPSLELLGPDGTTYPEVTQDMADVPNWLGLLRSVPPGKTEQGQVVFDAPIAAYKLEVSSQHAGDEQRAHVDIPVHLE